MAGLPEGIETVVMGVGDLNGILRGKRFPASHWPTIREEGMAMSNAIFVMDMTCDIWDTPYASMATGYPDVRVFPLSEVLHPMPWDPGAAFVMGRVEEEGGARVPVDPRNVLLDVVAKVEALGYDISIGAELEFYLLDPVTLRPRDTGIQVYGLDRAAELEPVLGPIRNDLVAAGIPVEQSNPEYAPGQVEVNIRFADAVETADRVVAFRGMVKQLAVAHGLVATFMSKPFFELSGSGFHAHHSLWKDGKNAFADAGELSDLGRSYLAGMQARMAETAVFAASTPNAYRRRQPYTFCPINNAWGVDNRTVALRVIHGRDNAVRVEQRDGSADVNPYLMLASQIAAGVEGIEQGLEPRPQETGDGYAADSHEPLPADLATAVELAKASEFVVKLVGEDLLGIYLQQCERELEFIDSQVTPAEVDRYLRTL